jgi:hypothetical protein
MCFEDIQAHIRTRDTQHSSVCACLCVCGQTSQHLSIQCWGGIVCWGTACSGTLPSCKAWAPTCQCWCTVKEWVELSRMSFSGRRFGWSETVCLWQESKRVVGDTGCLDWVRESLGVIRDQQLTISEKEHWCCPLPLQRESPRDNHWFDPSYRGEIISLLMNFGKIQGFGFPLISCDFWNYIQLLKNLVGDPSYPFSTIYSSQRQFFRVQYL